MTQRSRSYQTNASGSKPKGSQVNSYFLSTLLIDNLTDDSISPHSTYIRNSVGSLHPAVWESMLENTHGALNHPTRKAILTNSRKNSKNASTSEEGWSKREPTSHRGQSTKNNVALDVKNKMIPVDFLTSDDEIMPKDGATLYKSKNAKKVSSNIRNKITTDDLLTSDDEGWSKHGATLHRTKRTKNFGPNIRRKIIIDDLLTSDDDEKPKLGVTSNRTKNVKTVQFNIRNKNTTDDFLISSDEEPLEHKTTPSKTKSTNSIVFNERRKVTKDEFPRISNEERLNKTRGSKNVLSNVRKKVVHEELAFSAEITNKFNSKVVNNETKSRKGATHKTGKQTIPKDFKDVVDKSKLGLKRNEVLPTRNLRSSRKDSKPVRESRKVSDFSIENMDWFYEDEKYYVQQCLDILSDYALPNDCRIKSNAYTYLLLDSRRCKNRKNIDWIDFIYAIFYIGKGTGDRALQHAKDTEKWLIEKKTGTGKKDKKFQKIEEIWASQNPIKVFKVTENITDNEAFTREAAMIDAMGLRRLCNKVSGHYELGRAFLLKAMERCEFGATLLVEAWSIFKGTKANVEDVKPKKKEIFDLFFVKATNFNGGSDDEDELCYGYS